MSNLIPFGSALPAHLAAFALTDEQKAEILSTSVPSVKVLNGMMSVSIEGQTVISKRATLHVVVLGESPAPKKTYRSFYLGAWNPEAEAGPPDCTSSDGLVPTGGAHQQATSCDICPKNIEGSGQNGTGRACRYTKDLAVVIPELSWESVFRVRLSAMGIFAGLDAESGTMGYQTYSQLLAKQGLPVSTALVEIGFTDGSNQGMRFKPLGLLDAGMMAAVSTQEVKGRVSEVLKVRAPSLPSLAAPVAPAIAPLAPLAVGMAPPAIAAPVAVVEPPAPAPAPAPVAPPPVFVAPATPTAPPPAVAAVFATQDAGPAPVREVAQALPAQALFTAPAAVVPPVLRPAAPAPAAPTKDLNAAVAAAFN